MQGNDIGATTHKHVACMFEGLLMRPADGGVPIVPKRRWWKVGKEAEDVPDQIEESIEYIARTWRPNEMPLKSVIHMINQLGIGVEVYTYYEYEFHEAIEHWLARKGAPVQVYHYQDVNDLYDDFKFNRDVHTLFTTREEDAAILGIRATTVNPDGTFGI